MRAPGREELRRSFGSNAALYDGARPDYPEELLDALVAAAALGAGSRVLEVGCGTGQATVPLARRGVDVTAVELSEALARVARRNTRGLPVQVETADFEDWPGRGDQPPFDAVVSATAWHWIDPSVRYARAAQLLPPGGCLAVWSAGHVVPDDGDPFFREIQPVYEEIGEGLPTGTVFPRPGELPTAAGEMDESGWLRVVLERHFGWEVGYDADRYLALLDTFSGHIAMAAWQRERLYGEIRRRLAQRPDGTLRRHWGAALVVATRREGDDPGTSSDPRP